jgi:hypothetical protein
LLENGDSANGFGADAFICAEALTGIDLQEYSMFVEYCIIERL